MAHSLEVRVPLLDHRIVEFLASVPPDLKLKGLTKKYLLRRAMAGILPWSTVHGIKKGFNAPVAAWINRELKSIVDDVLSPKRIKDQGFFRPEVVGRLLLEHREKRANLSHPIWGLFCFGLWCDRYLK
jgi:asparagine synthase (glutamine-hydrolysing)